MLYVIAVNYLQWFLVRALGTIPGPLLTGFLFDQACSHWTDNCGVRGACLLYDVPRLSSYMFFMIFTVRVSFVETTSVCSRVKLKQV